MAAPMATHVRVKVYFENNEFDASWLLIDTSDLRTMKDVQRYISLKFLGKTVPLYLTLQGCFLPDWEKSVILRDNDCINAKCIHQDSYENQSILLAPNEEDEEIKRQNKKKKKKDKNVHLSTQSSNSNIIDEVKTASPEDNREISEQNKVSGSKAYSLKSHNDDRSKLSPMELDTSLTEKHKHKKKKHKHDKVLLEEISESDKGRKRKNDMEETFESQLITPSGVEPKKKKKMDEAENQELVICSTSCNQNDQSMNKESLENGEVDNEEQTVKRKRKRIRKRKRKNLNDTAEGKPQSEPINTSLNNTWNWGTGYNYTEVNDDQPRKQHKVFQSDESDSETESTIQNKSGAATQSFTTQNNTNNNCNNTKDHCKKQNNFNDFDSIQTDYDEANKFSDLNKNGGQPSILATSYLTNGVAVYSRNRKQNLRKYAELSKEAQLNTELTNVSVVIQNTPCTLDKVPKEPDQISYEAEPVDYSKFSALIGPPRVGDRLAYKVIELSEDYTPEVSCYKEAIVCSYNPVTNTVELDNQQAEKKKYRADGKFEVTFDDEEYSSNEVQDIKICLPIESLIEPKLIT